MKSSIAIVVGEVEARHGESGSNECEEIRDAELSRAPGRSNDLSKRGYEVPVMDVLGDVEVR